MTDPDIPANAGRYRPIEVIAPEGTLVNATFPVATVGGNSEVHPHLVTLIWKAMAEAVPDRVAAAGSETAMLVTYGGVYPTGEMFSNLILEGQGWGGKQAGDGFDVVTVPNSNCVVTPIEVYETRYPLLHHEFRLNVNSAGAGTSRGGLGSIRVLELRSPMTFSCYHSSERIYPWGLFGGGEGTLSSFEVKAPGDSGYATFKERYGVRCAGKFTNVHLPSGSLLKLTVGGGARLRAADEREEHPIAVDLLEGFVDEEYVRRHYPRQAWMPWCSGRSFSHDCVNGRTPRFQRCWTHASRLLPAPVGVLARLLPIASRERERSLSGRSAFGTRRGGGR